MNIHHDNAPLLPNGNHPNFRSYDATEGKYRSLYGREYRCPACERPFPTAEARDKHCHDRHMGEAE